MSKEIIDLAKELCEANAASHLMQANYRATLAIEESAKERLSEALWLRQEVGPVSIDLPNSKTIICNFDGEEKYEFSIIRRII